MFSVILGWILVVLGVLSYVVALVMFAKSQIAAPVEKGFPRFDSEDLKAIGELLDKLAKAIESFGKLSVPVQWALLGLVNIGIGAYLIGNPAF